jgi:DNA-3-methyladenine glycosylase II
MALYNSSTMASNKRKRLADVTEEEPIKSPYVALVGCIAGQKIAFNRARVIRRRLYLMMGSDTFTKEDIASKTDEDLLRTGMTKDNVKIVRAVHNVPTETAEDIRALKDRVPGIGEWTEESALLVSRLDTTVFPCGDLFLAKCLHDYLDLPRKPSPKQCKKIVEETWPDPAERGKMALKMWRWFEPRVVGEGLSS